MSTAPRQSVSEMHHSGVMRALCVCGCLHRAEQLEKIAGYWFAIGHVRNDVDDGDAVTAVWWAKINTV